MNIRETVGVSLLSAHLESQEWESAIDRVGALAFPTKLGRLIYHWRYAKQTRFAGPVLSELMTKAKHRFQMAEAHKDYPTLVRACRQAMLEFDSDQCTICTGAGEMIEGNLKIVCQVCVGSGKRRYPDEERIRYLRIDWSAYKRVWEDRMRQILGILTGHDSGATAECRFQLERN